MPYIPQNSESRMSFFTTGEHSFTHSFPVTRYGVSALLHRLWPKRENRPRKASSKLPTQIMCIFSLLLNPYICVLRRRGVRVRAVQRNDEVGSVTWRAMTTETRVKFTYSGLLILAGPFGLLIIFYSCLFSSPLCYVMSERKADWEEKECKTVNLLVGSMT